MSLARCLWGGCNGLLLLLESGFLKWILFIFPLRWREPHVALYERGLPASVYRTTGEGVVCGVSLPVQNGGRAVVHNNICV